MPTNDLSTMLYNDYLKIIENKGNVIVEIEVLVEKYNLTENKAINILLDEISYIRSQKEKENTLEKYVTIFDYLFSLKKMPDINNLENLITDVPYLIQNFDNYLNYYRPDILVLHPFRKEKVLKMLKTYNSHLQPKQENKELSHIYEVIKNFINSPYNIERFCLINKLSQSIFCSSSNASYIKKLKSNNPDLYEELLKNLQEKKEKLYNNSEIAIKTIMYFIKNIPDFSFIDFAQITDLDPTDLVKESVKYLNNEERILFKHKIDNLKNEFSIYGKITGKNNIKLLIETPYRYSQNGEIIESSQSDRENIVNYILKLNIPINAAIFNTAFTKFKENRLYNQNYDIEKLYLEYVNRVNNSPNKRIDLDELALSFNISKNEVLKRLIYYANSILKRDSIEDEFDIIIEESLKKSKNNLNSYLVEKGITPNILKKYFYDYLIYKRPDVIYVFKLLTKLKAILKNYGENYDFEKDFLKRADKAKDMLLELVESGYSIGRFCAKKCITIEEFNKMYNLFKKKYENDIMLLSKIDSYINYFLDDEKLFNAACELINDIKASNGTITYLDYFLLTKYSPREIIKIADERFSNEDAKLIRMTTGLFKFKLANSKEDIIQKQELIDTSYSFLLDDKIIESTKDVRKKVSDYLDKLYIPNESKTFYDAIVRYYSNNLKVEKQI